MNPVLLSACFNEVQDSLNIGQSGTMDKEKIWAKAMIFRLITNPRFKPWVSDFGFRILGFKLFLKINCIYLLNRFSN